MNVIDVTTNDREIPDGKVLLAQRKPEGEPFAQVHELDSKIGWKNSDLGRPRRLSPKSATTQHRDGQPERRRQACTS
jgi:hypothetical protein